MKLISATPSPYARKVRIALAEKSVWWGNSPMRWAARSASLLAARWATYLRFPELGWRGTHPNLARTMDGLMARPSFQATTPSPQSITGAVV